MSTFAVGEAVFVKDEHGNYEYGRVLDVVDDVLLVESMKTGVASWAYISSLSLPVRCGTCYRSFPDIYPAARCPYEYEHEDEEDESRPTPRLVALLAGAEKIHTLRLTDRSLDIIEAALRTQMEVDGDETSVEDSEWVLGIIRDKRSQS